MCGLASFFTQIKGLTAVLGIAAFVLWEQRQKGASCRSAVRQIVFLVAAFVSAVAIPSAYFVEKAGLHRFVYDTIEFGIKYYASEWSNNLRVYMTNPPLGSRWYAAIPSLTVFALIHALLPLVFVVFLLCYRIRTQSSRPWHSLLLLNTVGFFLFMGVAAAPVATRLYAVSPPALILFVWL
jgi:hypothetical protein